MKIDALKLKENEVSTFKENINPDIFEVNRDDLVFQGDIDLTYKVRKELGMLYTQNHLSAQVKCVCSRCLKECVERVEKEFDLRFPLDESNQIIDITEVMREEIILDSPWKFLCKQDCKGLCPRCGMDLNKEKCKCGNN